MKKITLFYLADCPYCHSAERALRELAAEKPAYQSIQVDRIEESREPEIADRYDYYYVPSVFAGEKKLYEVDPREDYASIKEHIRQALEAVL